MKVLPFLITKSTDKSFHLQENKEKHFYDLLHQHPEVQLTLILEGEGQLTANDYVGDFKPGDVFIFGSNMPHVFRNNECYYNDDFNRTVHSLSVFFNWEAFGKEFWKISELEHISQLHEKIQRGLKIEPQYKAQLQDHIQDLFLAEGIDTILILLRILNAISSMNHFNYLTKVIDFKPNSNDGDRLNNIYQFTMQNYKRQISLEDVADVANLAVNSFCRFFKKRTQKTYFEFLNEIRIGNACKLLVTDKSQCIYNICFEVGFNDIANFNRHFKKTTGFTPTEYKSLSRQEAVKHVVASAS